MAAVAAGLDAADAWCAPSATFRDTIATLYSCGSKGRVIRNGLDLPMTVLPKELFIVAAGRLWDEAKNLAALVDVAESLDWPVRVAGPVEEPCATTGPCVTTGVIALGALPRAALIAQMQRAAIFASPALYEPFGLSVLEAAACGCALVLADIPTLRELWDGAALFVAPRDREALRAALQRLCRDHRLLARMQHAAAAHARRYSRAAMLVGYCDLYRDVADQSFRAGSERSTRMVEELQA
jgi:glycosyltransferase involved in cell wall biosynthesis